MAYEKKESEPIARLERLSRLHAEAVFFVARML
jgi:hypothetical protein